MLDGKDDKHQRHANKERSVERDADWTNAMCKCSPASDRRRKRGNSSRSLIRARTDDARPMHGKPLRNLRAIRERNRRKCIQDISCGYGTAEGENRAPREPVAPNRERRDELHIADPGGGAVDRCATGFIREKTGDFGVGERLDEAHENGQCPNQERDLSRRPRDATDRKQNQRGNATRDPERPGPINRPMQLSLNVAILHCCINYTRHSLPPRLTSIFG